MTTPEPVYALAAMRQRLAEMTEDGATLPALAAVVQAEQTKRIADAMERVADAYVDATVDAAARLRLDDGQFKRAQRAAEDAKRCYDALRAEVERILGEMTKPLGPAVPYRILAGQLRRALEGGE